MRFSFRSGAVDSLPAEPPSLNEHSLSAELHLELAERQPIKCVNCHSFLLRMAQLAFLTAVLGLIVVAFACRQQRIRRASPGAERRRLASGGDDADESWPPLSPEVEILCWAAEGWMPADPLHGEPRSSPQMVEAFLEEITAPPESSQPAAASESLGESDDDEVSPRSKRPRQTPVHRPVLSSSPPLLPLSPRTTRAFFTGLEQPSEELPEQPSLQPPDHRQDPSPLQPPIGSLTPSEAFTSGQSPVAAYPPQTHEGQVPAGLLPVSGDEPSTSTATPAPRAVQQPLPQGSLVHPYVRLPTVQPGVTPRPWRRHVVTSFLMHERSCRRLLLEIRKLLLRPVLDANGLDELMTNAELLGNFAMRGLKKECLSTKPSEMVRDRGQRFLIMNALHSAAQVVSRQLPPWWGDVVNATLTKLDLPGSAASDAFNVLLARDLTAALRMYKAGSAPAPENIIDIKRRLFSSKHYSPSAWDPWREDDPQGPRR